jgi:hypothetical protein
MRRVFFSKDRRLTARGMTYENRVCLRESEKRE